MPATALTSQHLPTVVHFAQLLSGAVFRISQADDGCQLIECDGVGATVAPEKPAGATEPAAAVGGN